MTFPLNEFLVKATLQRHSEEYLIETQAYIALLESSGLPAIFTLEHLCLEAQVNIAHFRSIERSSRNRFYSRFKLRKKRGGFRVIHVPSNELKYLQRWILNNILQNVPSHGSCRGFDKGTSIKENAKPHLNQEAILKVDLLRFYDSINEHRIFAIFKKMGYHLNLAVSLARLCTITPDNKFFIAFKKNEIELRDQIRGNKQGLLPQGAPTSPKLANLVARRLDERLNALAERHQVVYTRYADDLTFSGSMVILEKLKKVIYKIIRTEGFFVNVGKTKFLKRGSKFQVTGLSVDNAKVKVPSKVKKEIEHHLFHCLKSGAHLHMIKARITNRNFKDWLLGMICYVNDIENDAGKLYLEQFNRIDWPI